MKKKEKKISFSTENLEFRVDPFFPGLRLFTAPKQNLGLVR
jgi:hypothetical protein